MFRTEHGFPYSIFQACIYNTYAFMHIIYTYIIIEIILILIMIIIMIVEIIIEKIKINMHAISHVYIYICVCVCFVRPLCAYLQAIPPLMYLPRQGSKVMVLPVKVFTKICMADFRSTRHKRQLEPTTFPVAATLHHDYYTDYTQLKRKLQS